MKCNLVWYQISTNDGNLKDERIARCGKIGNDEEMQFQRDLEGQNM